MIEVLAAPPILTVQDLGREGHRAEGVAPAGAMDRLALALVNRLVGNAATAAGFEWALGGGVLGLGDARWIATGGTSPVARVNGQPLPSWIAVRVRAGDQLVIEPPDRGRFAYLAISGGVEVPVVLGSRSTYLPGRFGGHEGRRLRAGDRIALGSGRSRLRTTDLPVSLRPDYQRPIRIMDGPQRELFGDEAWEELVSGRYVVSTASDRMGYRLDGRPLAHHGPSSLPSEPACPGAVQVPDGGSPIVLMPDGPTVGGYPKLAVVITADLGIMAQQPPGARPRFEGVSLGLAVSALRDQRNVVAMAGDRH